VLSPTISSSIDLAPFVVELRCPKCGCETAERLYFLFCSSTEVEHEYGWTVNQWEPSVVKEIAITAHKNWAASQSVSRVALVWVAGLSFLMSRLDLGTQRRRSDTACNGKFSSA
jgi:hypothetical protein